MTNETKTKIQELLKDHISQYPSQAAAVKKLKNVSEATVIQIVKGNWDLISEEMWTRVGKQIGWNVLGEWKMVPTRDYKKLVGFLEDAQSLSKTYALCGESGYGKSSVIKHYATQHRNVFYVECASYFNKRYFLSKIYSSMGYDSNGLNVFELVESVVANVEKLECPLIVMDEVDKLSDEVFYFFINFYNDMEDKCGLVLTATDHLEKRIRKGLRLNKKGYKEIFSRIKKRFISLNGTNKAEVKAICEANGVTDPMDINEAFNDYEGDLRRLKQKIHNLKKRNDEKGRSDAA